jgi:hypothetical protein
MTQNAAISIGQDQDWTLTTHADHRQRENDYTHSPTIGQDQQEEHTTHPSQGITSPNAGPMPLMNHSGDTAGIQTRTNADQAGCTIRYEQLIAGNTTSTPQAYRSRVNLMDSYINMQFIHYSDTQVQGTTPMNAGYTDSHQRKMSANEHQRQTNTFTK